MGRPKGSRNRVPLDKVSEHSRGIVTATSASTVEPISPAQKAAIIQSMASEPNPHTDQVSGAELAPDLVLTVRQIHVGSFHGLWELCRIEPDGTKVVISDANTKAMICNLARNEIIRCRQ